MFPAALYFGAPYSESLFLLLAVGAFYAARTGQLGLGGRVRRARVGHAQRRAAAPAAAGDALVELACRGGRATPPGSCSAPLGIAAYAAWLGLVEGDALRFLDVQEAWSRELSVPLAGAWDGLVAAVDGVRQLGVGLAHARVLRAWRPATRSGSPPST